MAVDIVSIGLDFIQEFGLLAILVLLVLDGALLLPVFPGEVVLVMAVATYVDDVPSLVFLIAVTSAAALVGSILLYGIVRIGGRTLVARFPGFFMMPKKRRERLEALFERPVGQGLVLVLRLVPLTRILVNIPAGLAKMPFGRFVGLSAIGILLYHGAFLGFTYQVNQPGSTLATQTERLEAAYASPAWAFVESNQVLVAIALLLLGIVIAVRAAVNMYRDPLESTGSVIGWATTMALFWGGVALAVVTYMEPDVVFATAATGGLDISAVAAYLGQQPVRLLWMTSAFGVFMGIALGRARGAVRRRRRRVRKVAKREAKIERRAAKAAARQHVNVLPPEADEEDEGPEFEDVDRLVFNEEGSAKQQDSPSDSDDMDDDEDADGDADDGEAVDETADERDDNGSDEDADDEGGVDFSNARRL